MNEKQWKTAAIVLWSASGVLAVGIAALVLHRSQRSKSDSVKPTWLKPSADAVVGVLSDQDPTYVRGWVDALFARGVTVEPVVPLAFGPREEGYERTTVKDLPEIPSTAAERAWMDRVEAAGLHFYKLNRLR